jgi:hypothetical protein
VAERKPEEASCERAEFGQCRCRIGVRVVVVASDIRGFERSARPKQSASGNGSDTASRDIFSCAGGLSGFHGTGCCIDRHASASRCKRAASYERFRERHSAGRERGSNTVREQQGRG